MKRTWLSLFYETGYLLVAGVFLLAAPETAFKLLFSNTSYGDVLPRLMGTVLLSIGIVFVQIVRLHIEELYTTTIVVRVPLMAVNLGLFAYSGNPLFLTLFVIVTLGVVLTITGTCSTGETRSMTTARSLIPNGQNSETHRVRRIFE